jgi:hypothetical protein
MLVKCSNFAHIARYVYIFFYVKRDSLWSSAVKTYNEVGIDKDEIIVIRNVTI